jgi:phytoene dehydrogenase-like protein
VTIPDTADAVVIGSGPNGLVAAIALARKGWDVVVLERGDAPGGAVRSDELTVPGYVHDTFSAFYGLLHASPVFDKLGLGDALEWAHFDTPVGAAVSPSRAAVIHRDPDATAAGLGPADAQAWTDLWRWWQRTGERFFDMTLQPVGAVRPALRFARKVGPRNAIATARMLLAPIEDFVADRFASEEARVLLASGITHSDVSLSDTGSAPMALILAMLAQQHGMPVPVGGAGRLTDALVSMLTEHGGIVATSAPATRIAVSRRRAVGVETPDGVVRARHAVLADTGPKALFIDLVGADHLPARFLDGLKLYRYGSGMFKVDLALRGQAPWTAPALRSAGVVHLMGDTEDMARGAFESSRGLLPRAPLMIVGQQTLADPSRAPAGGHTLWIEMHTPGNPRGDGAGELGGSGWDALRAGFTERVLGRLEHFAPGARDLIVGTSVLTPSDLFERNVNLVNGDVGGGSAALHQQLVFRPVPGWFRYRTPVKGLYLCSASAHPGGGVHGMSGWNAARRALKDSRRPGGIARTAGGARRRPTRS